MFDIFVHISLTSILVEFLDTISTFKQILVVMKLIFVERNFFFTLTPSFIDKKKITISNCKPRLLYIPNFTRVIKSVIPLCCIKSRKYKIVITKFLLKFLIVQYCLKK